MIVPPGRKYREISNVLGGTHPPPPKTVKTNSKHHRAQ